MSTIGDPDSIVKVRRGARPVAQETSYGTALRLPLREPFVTAPHALGVTQEIVRVGGAVDDTASRPRRDLIDESVVSSAKPNRARQ
jgi:hypothetical protein